jgi:hypothetical protein
MPPVTFNGLAEARPSVGMDARSASAALVGIARLEAGRSYVFRAEHASAAVSGSCQGYIDGAMPIVVEQLN